MKRKLLFAVLSACVLLILAYFLALPSKEKGEFVSYRVDLQQEELKLYWKNEKGEMFKSIGNLKTWLESKGKTLVFAMNAGMFRSNHSPQGVFIQEGKVLTPLDTESANGNFYLKPNGVFYIRKDKKAFVVTTENFAPDSSVFYATQSGPMLLINGAMLPAFKKGSENLTVRNGVGILPDGRVLFAMSKEPVNFYDFATYFKEQGCRYALYLDGFVSRTYLPEKEWMQTDGDFGVMVAVSKDGLESRQTY